MFDSSEVVKLKNYCSDLGSDRFLFQGPGGNVSIKLENSLIVKASGKWLKNVNKEEIFVTVDLNKIKSEIKKNNFDIKIKAKNSLLKPSIETMLHAIMPHKFVFHMHMINILKDLVCVDSFKRISKKMNKYKNWIWVDYFTPGAKLARAIKFALKEQDNNPNIIFMQNHGVVLGSNTLTEMNELIKQLSEIFITTNKFQHAHFNHNSLDKNLYKNNDFKLIDLNFLNILTQEPRLFNYLNNNWEIYPDHVVFLGSKPCIFNKIEDLLSVRKTIDLPELAFVKNVGIFHTEKFSYTKKVQLQCYFDILVRIDNNSTLKNLSKKEITFLLNWEEEKYRKNLL